MHRLTATMLVALTWCFLLADEPAAAPQSSATYSIELRVSVPAAQNRNDPILIVKWGPNETSTFSIEPWSSASLAQYFKSWREAAMDALFKQLHMA
jgi:hypothetical protein